MATWLIIVLTVYVVVFLGFVVALYVEAPKHRSEVGLGHITVAAVWPGWAIWYAWNVIRDYFRRK